MSVLSRWQALDPLPMTTERLELRAPAVADATALHAFYGDPEVTRYLPFDVLSHAECVDRLAALVVPSQSEDLFAARPMVDFEGRLVGELTLRVAGPDFEVAEVGWGFHPEVAGRGLATEASTALVALAFALGARRVEAHLDPRNIRSSALCERLGMRLTSLTRQDFWSKGEWTDTAVYTMEQTPSTPR